MDPRLRRGLDDHLLHGHGDGHLVLAERPQDGNETCTYTVVSPEVDSCTFTSPNLLTNGDSYTFTVTGTNGDGTGAASAPSNSVTPSTVPDAPTNVVASGDDQTATVTWTPGSNEGSTTTSYTVTATDTSSSPNDPTDGGETCTYTVASPEVDSCTFTSPNLLTNGDSYTFTVTGTNGDGTGAASAPSNSVTPSEAPSAPTDVVATAGNQTATVTWTHGASNGSTTDVVHGDGHGHLVPGPRPQRRRRDLHLHGGQPRGRQLHLHQPQPAGQR